MKDPVRNVACAGAIAALSCFSSTSLAAAIALDVTVTSNAPSGGVYLTPLFVGFHDGSFDSYDGGQPSSAALEMLAEDGNTSGLEAQLLADTNGNGVTGTVAGLLAPGGSQSSTFIVDSNSGNNYFSYASMVLPTSDYYVANGNPFAWDISAILSGNSNSLTFNIGLPGTVNDAGTEINDFWTSAGNGLFAGTGLEMGGQSGPNQGADENGVNTNVTGDPFANFIIQNQIGTILDIANNTLPLLNFNDNALYPNGIASITISAQAVPVPAAAPLFITAVLSMFGVKRFGKNKR